MKPTCITVKLFVFFYDPTFDLKCSVTFNVKEEWELVLLLDVFILLFGYEFYHETINVDLFHLQLDGTVAI